MTERNARVTTRTGDDGYTGLLGDARVPKWDARMEALGAIDEATSALGLARAQATEPEVRDTILALQRDLYLLMGELATPAENYEQVGLRITADHLATIDSQLEAFKARVQIGNQFIIPGATVAGAALDLARTIVRRGERAVARLLHEGTIGNRDTLRFLNRASDLLFVLARFEEHGQSDPTKTSRARKLSEPRSPARSAHSGGRSADGGGWGGSNPEGESGGAARDRSRGLDHGVPAIKPSHIDSGSNEPLFTEADVLAYAEMRHRDATVERVEFLTNGELRARTGHGENLLPDDAPLCLLTLHGKFAHEVPPFLSRPQREIPLADQLVVTFHGVTGNRLSEGFVHQKKPVDNSGSSGASQ